MIESREGKILYLETTATSIIRQHRNIHRAIIALKSEVENVAINNLQVAKVKLVDNAKRVDHVLRKLELELGLELDANV